MNIFNGIYNKISVLNFIFRNKNTNKSNENDNDIFFLWMEFFVMKKVFFKYNISYFELKYIKLSIN